MQGRYIADFGISISVNWSCYILILSRLRRRSRWSFSCALVNLGRVENSVSTCRVLSDVVRFSIDRLVGLPVVKEGANHFATVREGRLIDLGLQEMLLVANLLLFLI